MLTVTDNVCMYQELGMYVSMYATKHKSSTQLECKTPFAFDMK